VASTCPRCGAPGDPEHAYCSECGATLVSTRSASPEATPQGQPPAQPPPAVPYLPPPPPGFGAPPPAQPRVSMTAFAIIGTALFVLILGGAIALIVSNSGGGDAHVGGITSVTVTAETSAPSTPTSPGAVPTATATPSTPSIPQGGASSALVVTGQDASGYHTGTGCSDNPNSSLPGCNDSPSTPNGDPEGSCPNGITVDSQSTTCSLAENVYSAYRTDGSVTAFSPKNGTNYTFICATGGPGTTAFTICQSRAGNAPLYLRWHR
jgi:hypothetical protein